jgi:hypothetical protein
MRLSISLSIPALLLVSMSVGRLGAQQSHDGADIQKANVGTIAWQYDTGG